MLIKLWRWIFGGCEHKWIRIENIQNFKHASCTMPQHLIYVLQCDKCGNIKGTIIGMN